MLRFMLQKLMHKKGLVLSLIIGNVLLIAIASSHAIYKDVVLQRMLSREFEEVVKETNKPPVMFTVSYNISKLENNTDFHNARMLAEGLSTSLNLKEEILIAKYQTTPSNAISNLGAKPRTLKVGALWDLDNHTKIVSGRAPVRGLNENGYYEAVVSEAGLVNANIFIGEKLEFSKIKDTDKKPIKVEIVGVFKNSSDTDPYWVDSPNSFTDIVFVNYETFYDLFITPLESNGITPFFFSASWFIQMDYSYIKPEMSSDIIAKTNNLVTTYSQGNNDITVTATEHNAILEEFILSNSRITTSLFVLEVPVFALLCAFLFMISTQLIQLEENEISQLKSRGAGRFQIFCLYFLQSLTLGIIGMAGGIPLGVFFCQILGSANAFLEFVQRKALDITLTADIFIYAAIAMGLSIIMTVLPAVSHSKLSIVDTKQKRTHRGKPIWQKLFLDVIMLGISLYGYYSFNTKKEELLLDVLAGKSLDPLLFLSASLFVLGTGLFCLRIQPFLIKLIFMTGKKFWGPANFTSFLQLLRTGASQYFIMAFMIFTVSLGIFFATVARTIINNAENNTEYVIGADMVVREKWKRSVIPPHDYIEPDIDRYADTDWIDSFSKVLTYECTASLKNNNRLNFNMLAIDTREFGNTVNMDSELLDAHINEYLNTLGQIPKGIIVSENFRSIYGYDLGDSLIIKKSDNISGTALRMTIVGFVEYWPGYQSEIIVVNPDGTTTIKNNFLVISNYSTVLSSWTIHPYDIYIKLVEGKDSSNIAEFAETNDTQFVEYTDLASEIADIHSDPLFQGTNGILTMSFIVVLVLFIIGFLIYWILSIKSRELLFGVLRAMGMTQGDIIHMLINEQIFTGLVSIVLGCLIGVGVSYLFVPLIQIAYTTSTQTLPLELITDTGDMIKLFAIIGIAFVFCIAILTRLVCKMKISEALKLGED